MKNVFVGYSKKEIRLFLVLLILVIALPLTVFLAKKVQDLRSRAKIAGPTYLYLTGPRSVRPGDKSFYVDLYLFPGNPPREISAFEAYLSYPADKLDIESCEINTASFPIEIKKLCQGGNIDLAAQTTALSTPSPTPVQSTDFEVKTVNPGQNLTFNLTVGQNEVNNLPNNTPIEFTLLKRLASETPDSQMFGFAGVQGQWDLQDVHLDYHKKYYDQEDDSTLTTEKMLEKHFSMHAALGVKWVYMEYTWIQANQNQPINFYYLDKIFTVAKKYGLKILPILDETPRWATSLTCNEDQNDGYPTCAMATKCVPKDLTDNGSENFNNFVRQTVERYKPHGKYYQNTGEPDNGYGITHWVIWNEPNHNFGNFWTDCKQATTIFKNSNGQDVNQYDVGYRPVGSIQDYAKLFKGGYTTIKQVDPNAIVLMAGLAGIGPEDQHKKIESYEKFYAELNRINSPKPDIWNAHIYMEFISHFIWDLSFIKDKRNQLDPNKEIWVTEFGFYRDFTPGSLRQINIISDLFSQKDQLLSWNVKKLLYWTAKGYIMCDPNESGCIPYTNIASCGYKNYEGCQRCQGCPGAPYGEFEMGTLLMSPNFYPDPVYLKYGENMGTVAQVGDNIKTTVSNNQINVNIPSDRFQNGEKYILIMSSPTKIVTTKPWIVKVGE